MNVSQKGLDLIKNFEAFSPIPYHGKADKDGVTTILYGHVIKSWESNRFTEGPYTEADGDIVLKEDCAPAVACINTNVQPDLNQDQFDALVSFVFNEGYGHFVESTLLKKINEGDFDGAAAEFEKWDISNGKVQSGLEHRRVLEEHLFMFQGDR